MDETNKHLKVLLERTDSAFRALMQEPDSEQRSLAYEDAKSELQNFITSLKSSLTQRHFRG